MPVLTHYRDLVDLSSLPDRQRRLVWEGVKALDPDLAALLSNDPVFGGIKQHFSAQVRMTKAEIARYMEAGREALEEKAND